MCGVIEISKEFSGSEVQHVHGGVGKRVSFWIRLIRGLSVPTFRLARATERTWCPPDLGQGCLWRPVSIAFLPGLNFYL